MSVAALLRLGCPAKVGSAVVKAVAVCVVDGVAVAFSHQPDVQENPFAINRCAGVPGTVSPVSVP